MVIQSWFKALYTISKVSYGHGIAYHYQINHDHTIIVKFCIYLPKLTMAIQYDLALYTISKVSHGHGHSIMVKHCILSSKLTMAIQL